ncbi:MAG: adenylyltransferase/cytidyltransferase family protein [bacterium]|nr:adenylyltransferase/cytidyltransferase family protein [bacterium]
MKTVMAFGTFDLLHAGHINFLKQAKRRGDLIVVIARDKTVGQVKHKMPRHNEIERLRAVRGLKLARTVVQGSLTDKFAALKKYKPDLIALGYDQTHFTAELKKKFKHIKIIRLKAFQPEKYKTSIIKNYENSTRHE